MAKQKQAGNASNTPAAAILDEALLAELAAIIDQFDEQRLRGVKVSLKKELEKRRGRPNTR